MAIYHLTAKTGSRSGGQSAAAKAAYIQREGRYENQPDALVHTHSGHMPEWAATAADYWHAADTYERANGRLFKEVEFSLPRELSADDQRALATDFAQELTGKERLPYTLAIHEGQGDNPHCHLMISERANDGIARTPETWFKRANKKQPERGGAAKSTALKPKNWLADTREAWQTHANRALERSGHAARIDHRSLEAQREAAQQRGDERQAEALDREPMQHMGPSAAALERDGIETERGDENREREERNERRRGLYERVRDVGQQLQDVTNALFERTKTGLKAAHERFNARQQRMARGMEATRQRYNAHVDKRAAEQQRAKEQKQKEMLDRWKERTQDQGRDGPEMSL